MKKELSESLIAELLAAKMTHDLAGPVSAVSNGVELLSESEGEEARQATELLQMSASEVRVRLQLFRQAYGIIGGDTKVDVSEINELLQEYFKYLKVTLTIEVTPGAEQLQISARRILIHLVLLAASMLIMKSTIHVRVSKQGSKNLLLVRGESAKIKADPHVAAVLAGTFSPESLDVKTIQPYLLMVFAESLNAAVKWTHEDASVEISAQWEENTKS